jgi:hypothetical protein
LMASVACPGDCVLVALGRTVRGLAVVGLFLRDMPSIPQLAEVRATFAVRESGTESSI